MNLDAEKTRLLADADQRIAAMDETLDQMVAICRMRQSDMSRTELVAKQALSVNITAAILGSKELCDLLGLAIVRPAERDAGKGGE